MRGSETYLEMYVGFEEAATMCEASFLGTSIRQSTTSDVPLLRRSLALSARIYQPVKSFRNDDQLDGAVKWWQMRNAERGR